MWKIRKKISGFLPKKPIFMSDSKSCAAAIPPEAVLRLRHRLRQGCCLGKKNPKQSSLPYQRD